MPRSSLGMFVKGLLEGLSIGTGELSHTLALPVWVVWADCVPGALWAGRQCGTFKRRGYWGAVSSGRVVRVLLGKELKPFSGARWLVLARGCCERARLASPPL